jgi:hypothetical protein
MLGAFDAFSLESCSIVTSCVKPFPSWRSEKIMLDVSRLRPAIDVLGGKIRLFFIACPAS